MNHQQVRDIAEAAFKTRFGDIGIVSISVEPGFDHCDDPKLEVRIVYDAEVERLIAPDNAPDMVRVRSEIVEKVWAAAEDSPGYPFIHFIAKSDLEEDGAAAERATRLVTGDEALPFIDGNRRGATYALAEGGYRVIPKPGSIIDAIYGQLADGPKTGEALTQATKDTPRGSDAQAKVFGEDAAAGTLRWLVKQSRLHVVVEARVE